MIPPLLIIVVKHMISKVIVLFQNDEEKRGLLDPSSGQHNLIFSMKDKPPRSASHPTPFPLKHTPLPLTQTHQRLSWGDKNSYSRAEQQRSAHKVWICWPPPPPDKDKDFEPEESRRIFQNGNWIFSTNKSMEYYFLQRLALNRFKVSLGKINLWNYWLIKYIYLCG